MVWYFLQDHPTTWAITVACDDRSVLDQLRSKKSIDLFAAHADLLHACKNIQLQLMCKITFLHVKGQQDNGHPMVLSREAWLNIKTDLTAKSHISNDTPEHPNQPLPFKPWRLVINNEKVVKHHQWAIRLVMNGLAAKLYWVNKLPEVKHLHRELDLQAMERALSKSMLKEMGDKAHHGTLCTQKKYDAARPTIHGSLPLMPHQNGGQNTYHLLPSSKCLSTMDTQSAETQQMDERPRHGYGGVNGDYVTTRAMGKRQNTSSRYRGNICQRTTMDWMG